MVNMPPRKNKSYITPVAENYIIACKLNLAGLIEEKGWKVSALCCATGIPDSTMSQWLDLRHHEFIGFAEAVVICECLGVGVETVLPPSYWVGREQELEMGANVRQLAAIPFSHVRVLVQFYWSLRELLTRKK